LEFIVSKLYLHQELPDLLQTHPAFPVLIAEAWSS
jgi:hypothetical protein